MKTTYRPGTSDNRFTPPQPKRSGSAIVQPPAGGTDLSDDVTETLAPARKHRIKLWHIGAMVAVLALVALSGKGSGLKTRIMCRLVPGYWEKMSGPEIVATYPKDG